jgi:hypothetical protein
MLNAGFKMHKEASDIDQPKGLFTDGRLSVILTTCIPMYFHHVIASQALI